MLSASVAASVVKFVAACAPTDFSRLCLHPQLYFQHTPLALVCQFVVLGQ